MRRLLSPEKEKLLLLAVLWEGQGKKFTLAEQVSTKPPSNSFSLSWWLWVFFFSPLTNDFFMCNLHRASVRFCSVLEDGMLRQ